jgi:hypothetical protein
MTSCTTYTHTNGSNSNKQSNTVSARLTALEEDATTTGIIGSVAIHENWKAAAPMERTPHFISLVRAQCAHFQLNERLCKIRPNVELFKTPLEERSQKNPRCFSETHTLLLKTREEYLLPLLSQLYKEFPPTPLAAYRHLKLSEIESILEKISLTISSGARYCDWGDSYRQRERIEDHERQLNFLFDQFYQMTGVSVENYQEATQAYVGLLNSIFPAGVRPSEPSGDNTYLIYSVPAQAGI